MLKTEPTAGTGQLLCGHRETPPWAPGSTPVGTGKPPRPPQEGFMNSAQNETHRGHRAAAPWAPGKPPRAPGTSFFPRRVSRAALKPNPGVAQGPPEHPPSPGGTPESPPMLPEPPGSSQRDDGPGQVRPWGCPSGWTRARDSVPPRAGSSGGSGPAKVPCPPSLAPTPTPVPAPTPAPAVPAAPAPAVPAVNSQRDRSHPGAAAAS